MRAIIINYCSHSLFLGCFVLFWGRGAGREELYIYYCIGEYAFVVLSKAMLFGVDWLGYFGF